MAVVRILVVMIICCLKLVTCGFQSWPEAVTSSPEDVAKKWLRLENDAKDMIEQAIKVVLPIFTKIYSEINVEPRCSGSLLKMLLGIRNMEDWAIRMLDATGKPAGGQLMVSSSALGSYDECLDISLGGQGPVANHEIIQGMYCVLDIRLLMPPKTWRMYRTMVIPALKTFNSTEVIEKMKRIMGGFYVRGFALGLCIPSLCTKEDVQEIVTTALKDFGISTRVQSCEIKEDPSVDGAQLAVIALLGLFAVSVVLGTLIKSFVSSCDTHEQSVIVRLADSFSVISNTHRIMKVSDSSDDQTLSCLRGMRFFSMTWVLLGHTYIFQDYHLLREAIHQDEHLKRLLFQIVINGTLSVDSFFFIGSLLLSYNVVKRFKCKKTFPAPVLLVRRILKILPSAMLAVGLLVVLPLVGSGPLWKSIVQEQADNCHRSWWHVPLFITNFDSSTEMCLMHSWYISLDMQLFLLSMPILLFYFRKPKLCKFLLILLIIASFMAKTIVTWVRELPPVLMPIVIDSRALVDLPKYAYTLPYTHSAIYLIGLVLGMHLAEDHKVKIPWYFRLLGWTLAIVGNLVNVFFIVIWDGGYQEPVGLLPSIYGGLHGVVWGLGLSWIVLMCSNGHGGIINSFLSWKAFNPLNRLTFMIYLVHFFVILYQQGTLRGPLDSTQSNLVWQYFGNLSISFIAAFIMNLLFKTPLDNLEAMLFKRLDARRKVISDSPQSIIDDTKVSVILNSDKCTTKL